MTLLPKRKSVLIFPAGAENAIELYNSIKYSVHIRVVPTSSRKDISDLIYDEPVRFLPELSDPGFLDAVIRLSIDENIEVIMPTHDAAAVFFSEHSGLLKAKVTNSHLETNKICRSKRKTYERFAGQDFSLPIFDSPVSPELYPLFGKPDEGQGSKGIVLIPNAEEHNNLLKASSLVVTEYLPGDEMTVECFTDRSGELRFVGPRLRSEIRMGISFHSVAHELNDEIATIAQAINRQLKFRGMWFFQLKANANGEFKLLEVCTRMATTAGLYRHKGINLPLLTIFDLLGHPIKINEQAGELELFRTTKNIYRYSHTCNSIYVDLDDTLIIENQVNPILIKFLYKAANSGKYLALITRHDGDPIKTLQNYRIAPSLFDEIIHISPDDNKSRHISRENAILIDNWHSVREEVRALCNIPVFDVDAIESLETLL
jgi:hypothetical protein